MKTIGLKITKEAAKETKVKNPKEAIKEPDKKAD